LVLTALALAFSLALVGCSNAELSVKEKEQSAFFAGSGQLKRKVITRNSISEPLPPEAEKALSTPDKSGPQQLPNVDLSTPIIITKMPYPERTGEQ